MRLRRAYRQMNVVRLFMVCADSWAQVQQSRSDIQDLVGLPRDSMLFTPKLWLQELPCTKRATSPL